MKVVILHPPLYPVNHKLFNELGKHCDLAVISFGSHPGLHNNWKVKSFLDETNFYELIILEVETNSKKFAFSYNLQSSPKFLKYIEERKPDVVISIAFWMPSVYLAFLKKYLKCKLIILTDAIPNVDSKASLLRKTLRKFILSQTDCVLAGSDLTINYIQSLSKNVSIEKSIQTIDSEGWKHKISSLKDKKTLRKKYGYNVDDRILLSVGNLVEKKNVSSIIKQLEEIENCTLIVIGEGSLQNELSQQVQQLNLQNRVSFLGKKYEVELIKYYVMSDIFIFPSLYDQFGFVVPEALISGLPVICSKNTGASELIKDGYNGFLIGPEEEYADKINHIFLHLEEMSTNSKNSMENLSLKSKASKMHYILTKYV
jgi:glycosyltransferase involved in cell wall biosynthesis